MVAPSPTGFTGQPGFVITNVCPLSSIPFSGTVSSGGSRRKRPGLRICGGAGSGAQRFGAPLRGGAT